MINTIPVANWGSISSSLTKAPFELTPQIPRSSCCCGGIRVQRMGIRPRATTTRKWGSLSNFSLLCPLSSKPSMWLKEYCFFIFYELNYKPQKGQRKNLTFYLNERFKGLLIAHEAFSFCWAFFVYSYFVNLLTLNDKLISYEALSATCIGLPVFCEWKIKQGIF